MSYIESDKVLNIRSTNGTGVSISVVTEKEFHALLYRGPGYDVAHFP